MDYFDFIVGIVRVQGQLALEQIKDWEETDENI